MKKKIITILSCLLIASLLLSGCSLFKKETVSAVSLTRTALMNLTKAESSEIDMKTAGDFSMTYEVLNIGVGLTLDTDMKMKMTREPARAGGTVDFTAGAVGQEQKISGEFYRDTAQDGTATTYVRWNEGQWMKKTTSPGEKETETETETGENADSQGSGSEMSGIPGTVMQVVSIMKAIADGSLTAELSEETFQVNGKDAWKISFTVGGDFLKQITDAFGVDLDELTSDEEGIDWGDIMLPAELYIYKEEELPARVTVDCTAMGEKIVGKLFEQYMKQLPVSDVRLDVKSFTMDITMDNYNKVEAIEIPAGTAGAVESENLIPSMGDVIKLP